MNKNMSDTLPVICENAGRTIEVTMGTTLLEVERQLVDAVVALRELLGRGGAADRGIHLVGSLGKRPLDDGVVDEVLHAG